MRLVAADYEESTIRPHALGKFRDLVMATLESPAMLIYLDNAKNTKGKTNENYARELMELHTLGVGSGYTQQDVQQLAPILTGVGIGPRSGMRHGRRHQPRGVVRDGLFVFNPNKHDFSDKVLLGQRIEGSGRNRLLMADGDGSPAHPGVPTMDTPLYRGTLAPYLSEATRTALGQARSATEWNTFLLSSPDFNYR